MKLIKKALHFNDSALMPEKSSENYDNLYKIRPLVDYLNKRYQEVVNPEREQCIDEQMTLYKGKKAPEGLKQYIPGKPIQHGFKNWARCGASGYTYEVQFYQGKQKTDEMEVTNKCSAVVLKLTKDLPKGSFLFTDNLFSSMELLQALNKRGLNFVCTFRRNRLKDAQSKLTEKRDFEKRSRGAHEVIYNKCEKFAIIQWLDTKPVLLASNFTGIEPVSTCERWSKYEKKHIQVEMPNIVSWYNRFMGGVDLSDMLIGLYPIPSDTKYGT